MKRIFQVWHVLVRTAVRVYIKTSFPAFNITFTCHSAGVKYIRIEIVIVFRKGPNINFSNIPNYGHIGCKPFVMG